ncbi:MAG: HD domain-containing protein [Pseudomonadales bacterium]|nr:HD domain-containing protein [Pseudomonadales bacterium]
MIKLRDDYPLLNNGTVDYVSWVDRLCKKHVPLDPEPIEKACEFLCRIPRNGEKLISVGLEFADLLGDLHQDTDSVVVAILYRAQRGRHVKLADIEAAFGSSIVHLIREVNRMSTVSVLNLSNAPLLVSEERDQSENVRKMLVSLIDDVRVAIVKLAERIIALRLAKNAANSRRIRTASEALSIFAPLANRLGIWRLKWELEDLSFRYLQSEDYKHIAMQLSSRREQRESKIAEHAANLEHMLSASGIEAFVEGRAKNIYSIWEKMQRKGVSFSEIYDALAVRILVKEIKDCYAVLGVVHTKWRHIPKEFDDYIANPKGNGYQAIHTAVYDRSGNVLEVQIKTENMHRESDLGICAHWAYKDHNQLSDEDPVYAEKLAWLKQVLSRQEQLGDVALNAELSYILEQKRVYVYTPDGHVLDLGQGATPVDFAYRIHTDIGHNCASVRIDGKPAALNSTLKTGQCVEIIPGNNSGPNRDWLEVSQGFVKTSRARAKIQAWYRAQNYNENVSAGRILLNEELRRLNVGFSADFNIDQIARCLNYKSRDLLYHALSVGDCQILDVIQCSGVELEQHNQLELLDFQSDEKPLQHAELIIRGRDRSRLLHDITHVLSKENVTMVSLNASSDPLSITASISVTILIRDLVSLARVLDRIKSVPDVLSIVRHISK